MSLNIPGLDECRSDIMSKMQAKLAEVVYGGALDRYLYRQVETGGKNLTLHLAITIDLPQNLPPPPLELD